MPNIYELFGYPISERSPDVERVRKQALCPFMGAICDGGGNRHQTKILLQRPGEPLATYFDPRLQTVIPGVCSISAGSDTWVVCPRRLFAARNMTNAAPLLNYAFQDHERAILLQTDLPRNTDIGIWAEVYIKQQVDNSEINYYLDYVATPLVDLTLRAFLDQFHLSEVNIQREIALFLPHLKQRGYYPKEKKEAANIVMRLPSMEKPYIFEVMTASTSGSDTETGTDIRSAFRNAILGGEHESPGINKRQVWGRMVTQLFAKTALAHAWGGSTVWIIQDELLKNIELTTLLRTAKIEHGKDNTINLMIMQYTDLGEYRKVIALRDIIVGDSGLDFHGDETFTDILLPKTIPPKIELARAILRRSVDAIVRL